jgi:hypothetical protein
MFQPTRVTRLPAIHPQTGKLRSNYQYPTIDMLTVNPATPAALYDTDAINKVAPRAKFSRHEIP